MFSIGIIVCSLCTEDKPYREVKMGPLQLLQAVANGFRPTIPPGTPPAFVHLMERCWCTEPEERMSADQVVRYLVGDDPMDRDVDSVKCGSCGSLNDNISILCGTCDVPLPGATIDEPGMYGSNSQAGQDDEQGEQQSSGTGEGKSGSSLGGSGNDVSRNY
jgi:hypothetical protein